MRAHNHETRQEAIRRWQAGEKKSDISRTLEVDYNTLSGWVKRFQSEGLAGLKVKYSGCGRKQAAPAQVVERAKELRKAHPDWGGGYIRLNLLRELPGEKVPGERQLQRQLSGAGLGVRRTKLPSVAADWARKAFERVQVDAKERLRTLDGRECCYLNFIDEYTGAELEAFVFPHGRISQVPVGEVFDCVRYVLWRWGFIHCFRTDNGLPFGDPTRQALTPLNLCLRACGMAVKLNPARSPRKNAKVERNQGTTARWAGPSRCADYLDLQRQLDIAVLDQRENYPTRTCKGKTRAAQFPELFSNTRKFDPGDFDITRPYLHLAQGTWQRKISSVGSTDMFGRTYQVGYNLRGQVLTVTFDAKCLKWNFCNEHGELLKAVPADNLSETNIRSLSYCQ